MQNRDGTISPIRIKGSGNAKFEVLICPFCLSSADELGDPQGPDNDGFTLISCPQCGEKFFILTGKEMTFKRE